VPTLALFSRQRQLSIHDVFRQEEARTTAAQNRRRLFENGCKTGMIAAPSLVCALNLIGSLAADLPFVELSKK